MAGKLAQWYRSTLGHATVGAVLFWAALPPLNLWPLAWIAPVWWIPLIRRQKPLEETDRRPYFKLWMVGFAFWLAALHWLRLPHWATSFGWVALAFYLGFYLPVFIGLSRVAVHRLRIPVVVAAPVVWTGLELARAHLLTGITMGALSHTQYHWIELIQAADLGGAYAVGFVMMLVAASLARMVPCEGTRWTFWPLLPTGLVLAAVLAYGHARLRHAPARPELRIALIQGSIDIELKCDPDMQNVILKHYLDLTAKAVDRFGPLDVIVWPETMFPGRLVSYDDNATPPPGCGYSQHDFDVAVEKAARQTESELAQLARHFHTALLLGRDDEHYGAGTVKLFNSAVFVDSEGNLRGRYDKMHRVLFGEYVPFADRFPWLQRLTPLPVSIAAGSRPAAFELKGLRLTPNICYESVLPHVIRRQVNELARAGEEPDVLVNLTNDGWFWGSSELDMHLVCAVFRAVECRKPFLIAANTGFSAWIDADGRILAQGPRRAPDVLLAEVGRDGRGSWYLEHGDVLAGSCLAACLVLALVGLWDGWKSRAARARGAADGQSG